MLHEIEKSVASNGFRA